MRHKLVCGFFIFSLILLCSQTAWAYFDPGTGGYLISSILAALGSFFAFVTALVVYFFRNFVIKGIQFLWLKHKVLFIAVIYAISLCLGLLVYQLTFKPAPDIPPFDPVLSGAYIIDKAGISPGYDLFDGKLMDNEGHILKSWSSINNAKLGVLDKNGDYYAQKDSDKPVWGRYTWDDQTVWEKHAFIHHEILLTPQNTVIVFGQDYHDYNGRTMAFDTISEFDKNGSLLQTYSFWDHLKEFQKLHGKLESDAPNMMFFLDDMHKVSNLSPDFKNSYYDSNIHSFDFRKSYYHLNTLSIIPHNSLENRGPAFHAGNWLISFRHGSMLFILDRDTKKILWHAIDKQIQGHLEGQHSAIMLPSGHILIFDNGRYRKWSRLIEIDPVTLKILWEYKSDHFYSKDQGMVQKLPSGNLLVTESDKGHVFELTPNKQIVWEYYDPRQINPQDATEENISFRHEIIQMYRYPLEMIDPLLKK